MRVTNNLISSTVNQNLEQNYSRILKLQNTVSTGKNIDKPSDDPVGVGNVLSFRKKMASIDQYGRNIQWGNSWLRTTDAAMASMDTLLIRAKELAVNQASETSSEATRNIAAEEVGQIFDQMVQLANTSVGGRYIFAGHHTDTAPYTRDDAYNATCSGDTGEVRIIVGEDVDMAVNASGEDVFNGAVDVFDMLKALKEGLESNDTAAISGQIEQLDTAMSQVLNERAKAGARLNRLEATENHWQDLRFNTQEMLSEIEDADLVTALTNLKSMETAYEAALRASASIIQPSLMNFLR